MPSFPVVVFAYNRPEHLRRTLRALARNRLADSTDVILFSDGPGTEEDRNAVSKVREISKRVEGFRTLEVVEREKNLGLSRSIREGVTEVLQSHPAVIVLEDDLLTHPFFLEMMSGALSRYQEDSRILSVSGYLPPWWRLRVRASTVPDIWLSTRHLSFGWGTWAEKWTSVDWQRAEQEAFDQDPDAWRSFASQGGEDLPWMLLEEMKGHLQSWSIRFNYEHFRSNRFALLPGSTYLRPIGFDGTGRHCRPNPLRWLESTLGARESIDWPTTAEVDPKLNQALASSFTRHHRLAVRLGMVSPHAVETQDPK